MVLSLIWEALISVSSPTVQSRTMALGPMVQPQPMWVSPRRMVPGRIMVPRPMVTRGSIYTAFGSSTRTPARMCRRTIRSRSRGSSSATVSRLKTGTQPGISSAAETALVIFSCQTAWSS